MSMIGADFPAAGVEAPGPPPRKRAAPRGTAPVLTTIASDQ